MININDNRFTNEIWYTYNDRNIITNRREIFSTDISHSIKEGSYYYDEEGRNYIIEKNSRTYRRDENKINVEEYDNVIFKYLYKDNNEKPISCVNKNNELLMTFKYNDHGDIIEKHHVKLNYKRKYIYDNNNQVIEVHTQNNFGIPCHKYFKYDDKGNRVYERIHDNEDLNDGTSVGVYHYVYNENNKIIREESTYVYSNGDIHKDIIHYEYNDKNQLIHKYRDLIESDYKHMMEVFYDYDDRGNIIHEFKYTNDMDVDLIDTR